ncbi:hypothetical protein EG68_05906 [Paragonimus skrjabini miyazakii]|uniref:Methyltransferase-like protein 5 n=1 Tax=Paragonimus skrjabini miyazakii TaxID=59628 RepID=A0A8S9YN90_9TREM|nr:hypothetical protein EG68_05906 [Paragonimus skrjabini miyazakii]
MPSCILSRKRLQSYLQDVDTFSQPNLLLEQYPTSPHVAADILFNIQTTEGAIQGFSVADFGCGSGILTIGARLLGARYVYELRGGKISSYVLAVDVDKNAISDLNENLTSFDLKNDCVDALLCDVTRLRGGNERKQVDTVIMNPPFGTNASSTGIDKLFLLTALSMAQYHVYSLHKTTTRSHILRTIESAGAHAKVVAELRFDIPRMYKRHRHETVDIEVDLVHAWF